MLARSLQRAQRLKASAIEGPITERGAIESDLSGGDLKFLGHFILPLDSLLWGKNNCIASELFA